SGGLYVQRAVTFAAILRTARAFLIVSTTPTALLTSGPLKYHSGRLVRPPENATSTLRMFPSENSNGFSSTSSRPAAVCPSTPPTGPPTAPPTTTPTNSRALVIAIVTLPSTRCFTSILLLGAPSTA